MGKNSKTKNKKTEPQQNYSCMSYGYTLYSSKDNNNSLGLYTDNKYDNKKKGIGKGNNK